MIERAVPKISKFFVEQSYLVLLKLHEDIISLSGGEQGVRDEGGLYHSVYKILLYQERFEEQPGKIASLIFRELAQKHHFTDGNKRTSYAFAKVSLYLLGYHFSIKYEEALSQIVTIASYQSSLSKEQIAQWIEEHLEKIE